MNWNEFASEMEALAKKIDLQPDYIVGIVRGGLIPARILSSLLKVKSMFALNVEKVGEEREVFSSVDFPLVGQTILLVEDMLETGKSLIVAKKKLEDQGAIVHTACLYTMPISECQPDFSLREVQEVVRFPWE